MKLSKFAKMVKTYGACYIYHLETGGIWLGTGYSIYRADGLPESIDAETMPAVLDFDAKQAAKTIIKDNYCEDAADMVNVDLRDSADDITARQIQIAAIRRGVMATALLCDDGELVFYNNALLSPLSDVLKNSDYVETTTRIGRDGLHYIVVHDGFDVIGSIAPMDVINKDFIGDLEEFQSLCVSQYLRQQERAATRDYIGGGEQTSIDGDAEETEAGDNDD